MLLLDARGNDGEPMNTMNGSHLVFNGGDGNDKVEMYFVSVGTIYLFLYNVDSDRVFGRCHDEDELFTPSFNSSGIVESNEYIFVDVKDCCTAQFSWDAICGENSARRHLKQRDEEEKQVFVPNYIASACESKLLSQFKTHEPETFDTLLDCCSNKFPNSITSCCDVTGTSGCALSGSIKWLPDWANGHCYEKDTNLIEEWEMRWAHETLETCCNRCKFVESSRTLTS